MDHKPMIQTSVMEVKLLNLSTEGVHNCTTNDPPAKLQHTWLEDVSLFLQVRNLIVNEVVNLISQDGLVQDL